MLNISYIILGIATGFASGFLGIGGGLIVVPALVFIYGLTQHQAQGTSLAMMIPPITLIAAIRYFKSGNLKVDIAAYLALGFLLGAFLGANAVQAINEVVLKRLFGFVFLIVSIKMILAK